MTKVEPVEPGLAGLPVLVVDDNPLNRAAFESILTRAGFRVVLAESGAQALQHAFKADFAVIVMDVRMPGIDGIETATVLRERERTRHTPILFLSAYDQTSAHVWRGYVAGATDYLFSPVDEEVLRFKVAAFARIYVRSEHLRARIRDLTDLVKQLQAELDLFKPREHALRQRIRALEDATETLQRELAEVF